MNKPLKRNVTQLYYFEDGQKVIGPNPNMTGNCLGLRGDCSELRGDLTKIEKRPSHISDYVQD